MIAVENCKSGRLKEIFYLFVKTWVDARVVEDHGQNRQLVPGTPNDYNSDVNDEDTKTTLVKEFITNTMTMTEYPLGQLWIIMMITNNDGVDNDDDN